METASRNPQLTTLAYLMGWVEFLVLLITSFGLIAIPSVTRPMWMWEIAPFNTRFMGAVYAGSAVALGMLVLRKRWSPAKVVLAMILVFTVHVIVLSFVYLGNFVPGKWSTFAWFFLYIVLPINAAYHLWKYRNAEMPEPLSIPEWAKLLFVIVGGAMVFYTLALVIAPVAASVFWPWAIDPFHARMYAAMFLAAGVGSIMIGLNGSADDILTVGLGKILFGGFAILGMILVDMEVKRVIWSGAGTWLWMVMFGIMIASGIVAIILSRRGAAKG